MSKWEATHRHRKGGLYRIIARGRFERDLAEAVVYDDEEGNVWVRPAGEFDERFKALPPPINAVSNTSPLILYFGSNTDRDEFVSAWKEARPGHRTVKL